MSKTKKTKEKTMTTNRNLDHLSGANRKRVKHPAISARILTTGLSIASVLGITSGFSLLPINKQSTNDSNSTDQISGVALVASQGLVAPQAAVASQAIAAVSPVQTESLAPVQTASLAPVQTAPQVVVIAPQAQAPMKNKTIQVQVSTTSSGSK
jgi:hypothetical protein